MATNNAINATLPVFDKYTVQIFTSGGTYTPTTGMKFCRVRLVGGGGGTAGSPATSAVQASFSSGGGAGGYAESILSAATVGASQTITIGAGGTAGTNAPTNGGTGGTTSFGAILSATGGVGTTQQSALANTTISFAIGGAGGSGSGGNVLNIVGSNGGYGFILGANVAGGMGGASLLGGSINNLGNGSPAAGQSGISYGSGGSGSASTNSAGQAGGAGSSGIVIIEEFCSV
jgi:hypothetical protein